MASLLIAGKTENGKRLSDPFLGACVCVAAWSHWAQMNKQAWARQVTAAGDRRTTTCSILCLLLLLLHLLLLLLLRLCCAICSWRANQLGAISDSAQSADGQHGGYAMQHAAYAVWEAASCQAVALAT